jgi:hypothetical protein
MCSNYANIHISNCFSIFLQLIHYIRGNWQLSSLWLNFLLELNLHTHMCCNCAHYIVVIGLVLLLQLVHCISGNSFHLLISYVDVSIGVPDLLKIMLQLAHCNSLQLVLGFTSFFIF